MTITANGTTEITPDANKELTKVVATVNVPGAETQTKSVTITQNGSSSVTPDAGKTLSSVSITTNVPQAVPIDVATVAEMNAKLVAGNVGKAYRFTGTTGATYTHGDIYIVEEIT